MNFLMVSFKDCLALLFIMFVILGNWCLIQGFNQLVNGDWLLELV